MSFTLLQRRSILWPTRLGWLCLACFFFAPLLLWWFRGEAFLSLTERQPAEVLVVEGWIGLEGFKAAVTEFKQGDYHYVVASGGLTNNRWDDSQWNYAERAESELIRLGLPADNVIAAPAGEAQEHRTFGTAVAVRQKLHDLGIQTQAVNVFTLGVHARRSRLVYAKAFGDRVKVGVVSACAPDYALLPWWHSSERASFLLKETTGYLLELLLNSGRLSNSPENTSLQKTINHR